MPNTQDPRARYTKALMFAAHEITFACRGISDRQPCLDCQETSAILTDLANRIAQAPCISGHGTDAGNILNIVIPFDVREDRPRRQY